MAIARFSTLPRKERDQFLPSGNLEWYQLVMTCREWYSLAYTGPDWSTLVQSDHNYWFRALCHRSIIWVFILSAYECLLLFLNRWPQTMSSKRDGNNRQRFFFQRQIDLNMFWLLWRSIGDNYPPQHMWHIIRTTVLSNCTQCWDLFLCYNITGDATSGVIMDRLIIAFLSFIIWQNYFKIPSLKVPKLINR